MHTQASRVRQRKAAGKPNVSQSVNTFAGHTSQKTRQSYWLKKRCARQQRRARKHPDPNPSFHARTCAFSLLKTRSKWATYAPICSSYSRKSSSVFGSVCESRNSRMFLLTCRSVQGCKFRGLLNLAGVAAFALICPHPTIQLLTS
eukprot:1142352-Pelagomonas_calceolata.AAC.5